MIVVLVSASMGKQIRKDSVNIFLRIISIILSFFNFFIMISAYYKLFQTDMNLSFWVTGVYAFSYIFPPMIYDHTNYLHELHQQYFGLICYLLCIPMYQIVFQIFAYANIHDVSWGNRDASTDT